MIRCGYEGDNTLALAEKCERYRETGCVMHVPSETRDKCSLMAAIRGYERAVIGTREDRN